MEETMSDSDIRTSVLMVLNSETKVDYEDLITRVSHDLQIDSEDVRRVIENGLKEKVLCQEGTYVLRQFNS